MSINDYLYRIMYYLRHCLTACNTGGNGIHSPYLFEWIRFVVRDKNSYYIWQDIEVCRTQLLHNESELEYVELGAGIRGVSRRRVCDIARSSLMEANYAQFLFRLVNWLGMKKRGALKDGESQGLMIMELGTSLGVTTSYLAACNAADKVVTFDGCPAVVSLAKEQWERLGMQNVESVVGNIDDTLFNYALAREIDVAFIDANHTYEATCRYFRFLANHMSKRGVIVVDDIHYSCEMKQAWDWICRYPGVTTTMDFYRMGVVFFDPHFLLKHYRLWAK